jgi:Phasin protein
MSGPNQNKPGGKSGQRNRKADAQRSQKPPVQPLSPESGQPPIQEPVKPQASAPVQLQNPKPLQQQAGNKLSDPARASENSLSIDFQAIAMAYSDYTRKSFEETKTFVEKLSGVRSLDKVIEIQTEYARQAYETFVTESQKIRELYSGLARQSFKPLESLVAKATQAGR